MQDLYHVSYQIEKIRQLGNNWRKYMNNVKKKRNDE